MPATLKYTRQVWRGYLLFAVLCIGGIALAEPKPAITVDLLNHGMRPDFFRETTDQNCKYSYLGYRSVQWLDEQRILVAFNTTPECFQTAGPRSGSIRLAVFDLQGRQLHSTDVAYDAGEGLAIPALVHDGLWIGPSQTVLIELVGSHSKAQPDSRNKLMVLSSDLQPIQEIDTDSHETYWDRINFGRITDDRLRALFWSSDGGVGHERKCFIYTGVPLRQTGTCAETDLDQSDPPAEYGHSPLLPRDHEVRAFAGKSIDGSRASLFGVKKSVLCDDFGKFCPTDGKLIVFDTKKGQLLFSGRLPLSGRAALSPTGKQVAALEGNNHLEIFVLP